MNVTGLITEYNPFHNGHAYHIQKAKELTGADCTIAVMSGDYVQRGTPAFLPKHIRTGMALAGGADMVLELPVSYATASAEKFAFGGVSILNQLGIVDNLCFGCECGDSDVLTQIAQVLDAEPDSYRCALQRGLKKGLSYPAARCAALPAYAAILNSPNNILGIEYCKALRRLKSKINVTALKRKGSHYHEENLAEDLPSASALRLALTGDSTPESVKAHFPPSVYELLKTSSFCTQDDFSGLLSYRLLLCASHEELCVYEDMSEELARRIFKQRFRFSSFSGFAALLKTKEVTRTRIDRVLLHLLLDIKKAPPSQPYLRLLGFKKEKKHLLSEIKKSALAPLLTKPADYKKILDAEGQSLFEENLRASMIYESVSAAREHRPIVHEFERPLVLR